MGLCVCSGAQLTCTFGAAPGVLVVVPARRVMTTAPAATILDYLPMSNITGFGMCSSPANPAVAAATAAALGVLTPQPCIPATASPWAPGAQGLVIGGVPALDSLSCLTCNWAGVIRVAYPGQTKAVIA